MKLKMLPILFFIVLVVFLWRGLSLDPHHLPSAQIGKHIPEFHLPVLGDAHASFSDTLTNKVSILNVWASWCQACVEEQVFLMDLASQHIPLYGLNYKDTTEHANSWLEQWGNPYIMVAEDRDGKAAIDLGVYGAPETFVIDKKGMIRYRHVGVLTKDVWDKDIKPLMALLERAA